MTSQTEDQERYRIAVLPGIGRVLVPASLSDDEVLDSLGEPPAVGHDAAGPAD